MVNRVGNNEFRPVDVPALEVLCSILTLYLNHCASPVVAAWGRGALFRFDVPARILRVRVGYIPGTKKNKKEIANKAT